MMPYFQERFGNASSAGHSFGWEAEAAVANAGEQVAALIGAQPKDIVWTSGPPNRSIWPSRCGRRLQAQGPPSRELRHRAQRRPWIALEHLQKAGFTITLLSVDSEGGII